MFGVHLEVVLVGAHPLLLNLHSVGMVHHVVDGDMGVDEVDLAHAGTRNPLGLLLLVHRHGIARWRTMGIIVRSDLVDLVLW